MKLAKLQEIVEAARIKPAVVEVESHPYLPEWDLLEYCRRHGIVLLAFAALGQEIRDGVATNIRFNAGVETGVPGFIPRGR